MIKVLIVDDSHTTMEYLKYLLDSDDEIMIVGIAQNGKQAIELSKKKQPDVILMDINMPKMNGFEATRIIMENNPVPIIIMSSIHDIKDTAVVFRAMEAGAVTLLNKPWGMDHPDYKRDSEDLLQNIKLMSEVKVIKRSKSIREPARMPETRPPVARPVVKPVAKQIAKSGRISVIAIGASAGGPLVLQEILLKIPKNFPVPILIVQHISSGFIDGLIKWLGQTTECTIQLAAHGEILLPGHVYFAPDDYHMGVNNSNQIILSKAEPENSSRPAISFLFRSMAKVYGAEASGVLLTGMGKDGADELKLMRDKGAVTIAQDKKSSLVHGMAGEAIKLDAVMYELSPESISDKLISIVQ
ncbi:chemotaxis-specific protein-glutamate methyltransferase CheB [Desulfobacula toluolica]|uniref:Protein-glutamate methylesterase/protein-glutamine glutaminase n=1 Tax=Desulfobacula toluolica (strain DSM 7467 / Tol2) TaxID=651182 RepID=K0N835_DESTT|nr:chemotaxis-specific protein-glutamate methyltransferase CheB [Desulfobacula toluolica]CCK80059.1 two component system response regulator modulated glutamate methylesterase (CheB-like) [Desulfobacula toluolica Tol2]